MDNQQRFPAAELNPGGKKAKKLLAGVAPPITTPRCASIY
jgi:hypothetical protein